MSNHSSYLSLSGFSGVLVGIFGCIAIFFVNTMTDGYGMYFDGFSQLPILFIEIGIIVISVLIILISLLIIWKRGKNSAKKHREKLWNSISRKQRFNVLVPLIVLIAILIFIANKGYYSFITPMVLAFYGIILLNLSRLHSKSLISLAIAEFMLALIAYFSYNNEILLLFIGVGLLPIIYGIVTFKNNKKAIKN